jgi:hypothetical protein
VAFFASSEVSSHPVQPHGSIVASCCVTKNLCIANYPELLHSQVAMMTGAKMDQLRELVTKHL